MTEERKETSGEKLPSPEALKMADYVVADNFAAESSLDLSKMPAATQDYYDYYYEQSKFGLSYPPVQSSTENSISNGAYQGHTLPSPFSSLGVGGAASQAGYLNLQTEGQKKKQQQQKEQFSTIRTPKTDLSVQENHQLLDYNVGTGGGSGFSAGAFDIAGSATGAGMANKMAQRRKLALLRRRLKQKFLLQQQQRRKLLLQHQLQQQENQEQEETEQQQQQQQQQYLRQQQLRQQQQLRRQRLRRLQLQRQQELQLQKQREQQQQQQQQQYSLYGDGNVGGKSSSLYDSNFDYYEDNGITETTDDPGGSDSNSRLSAIMRRRQQQQRQLALSRGAGYGATNQENGFNSFLNEDYGGGETADYGSAASGALNRAGGLGLGLDYEYNDYSSLGGGLGSSAGIVSRHGYGGGGGGHDPLVILKRKKNTDQDSILDQLFGGTQLDYETFALALAALGLVAGFAIYQAILSNGKRKRSFGQEQENSEPSWLEKISDFVYQGKLVSLRR